VRGCRIIDDYFEHHEAARDDELVRSTSARVEKNLRELRGLINGLGEFAVQREGRAEPAATAPPPRRAAGEFIPAPG
jgi:hypothetical protein